MRTHYQPIRSGTQSVERAIALLKLVSVTNATGSKFTELMQQSQLNRTTLHRLLKCLIQQEVIRYDAKKKCYFLGQLIFQFGIVSKQQVDLHALLSASLTRIAEDTGDTAFLLVRSENDAIYIDRRAGSYPIKTFVVEVGTRRPLGIGAGSLTMLSALSQQEIKRVVQANETALAAFGQTPKRLLAAVAITQKKGYASIPVEGLSGVVALGLPVLDPQGTPIAAFSVAAIAERMSPSRQKKITQILKREAILLQGLLTNKNVLDH